MSFWGAGANNANATAAAPGTEVIAVTLGPVSVPRDSELVLVTASFALTHLGTSNTSTTIRLRRGATLTDAVLGNPVVDTNLTLAAATVFGSLQWFDTLQGFATVQYSLTAQLAGSGANGSITNASIAAIFFL